MKILRVNNFTCVLHNVTCFHLGVHLHSLTTTVTPLAPRQLRADYNDDVTNPQMWHRRDDNDEGAWGWWGKKWAQGRVYKGMPAFLSFIVLLLTLLYLPHRHDERGETPSCRVLFHTDMTRRGVPPPTMLPSTQTQQEGESPSHCVWFHTDVMRGETPSCLVLFIQMWWEGVSPFPPCYLPHRHDERGKTPSRCVSVHEKWSPLLSFFCTNGHDERGESHILLLTAYTHLS